LVRKYSDDEKHQTGRQSSTSDFVKHECPATTQKKWVNGEEKEVPLVQKKEFNAIKGNEKMIAVNARASDTCGYCGLPVDSDKMQPCTDADVEALSQ